jgi:hypothetical protein
MPPARRTQIISTVEAYNRTHPPLPRNAGLLLAVMFAEADTCRQSQAHLIASGFSRKRLPTMLRCLIEAGFLSRQAGTSRIPDEYRLLLS